MINFSAELDFLQEKRLLPDKNYFSRFPKPYDNTTDFWIGLARPIVLPILNGLAVIVYATRAVWAALRAIGNLLILKPNAAGYALDDVATHLTLTLALGVMAPIHVLTTGLEVLTRTISSWFSKESTIYLSEASFSDIFEEQTDSSAFLPSSKTINRERFFAPHKDALSFLTSVASPLVRGIGSGFSSLYHAAHAIYAAIHLFVNLVIAKPKHAGECTRDFGVHATLAISFAMMTPINALLDSIACITRLGSTWVDAISQNNELPSAAPK